MARRGQRQSGATRTTRRPQRRVRERDNDGIIPVLARAVREVEASVERGSLKQSDRPKFQVVAMLMREERARVKADTEITEPQRAEQLKRLEGIATILAKTAARNTSLLALLAEDAVSCQAPEEVGGTGLADSELLLYVAHGEDGTGEQQVDDFRCPATGSAQTCPVLFAQI